MTSLSNPDKPTTIAECMAADVNSFTRDDVRLDLIINEMRQMRIGYKEGNKKAGKKPKYAKPGSAAETLNLEDLGL